MIILLINKVHIRIASITLFEFYLWKFHVENSKILIKTEKKTASNLHRTN